MMNRHRISPPTPDFPPPARKITSFERKSRPGVEREGNLPLLYLERRAVGPDRVRPGGRGRTAEDDPHLRAGGPHVGGKLVSATGHPLRSLFVDLEGVRERPGG